MIKNKYFNENLLLFLIMLLAVPIAGELKFQPFNGDFRVSFGTPAFFLFLLWLRRVHPVISGLVVGIFVVAFRITLDGIAVNQFNWVHSFTLHFPAFFYYLAFASAFHISRIHRFYYQPVWIGVFGVFIEVTASMSEISVRSILNDHLFSFSMLYQIIIIAIIRSFFVLGIFNISMLRDASMAAEQQRQRNDKMTLIISKLYEESVQLKKSMQHAEDVTRECYDLYRQLRNISEAHAQSALKIAGQVHEIKKDNYRIFAGLSQVISHESIKNKISMEELAQLIKTSNEKYAQLLGKKIDIHVEIQGQHPYYHTFTILSLINNLVSNSIEAIQTEGSVTILFAEKGDNIEISVSDNGPGIPEEHQALIYQPGFTTKYDHSGNPSTGIGLSYIRELVISLDGKLVVHSNKTGSTFTIQLPKAKLIK